jgi:hypothetical protein
MAMSSKKFFTEEFRNLAEKIIKERLMRFSRVANIKFAVAEKGGF